MKIIFFLASLIFSSVCLSQSDEKFLTILSRLDSVMLNYSEKYPQERIALLSDKTQYTAGENIWLNCLVTVDGAPSFVSKVLYIELIDAAGKLVDKKMLPVEKGIAYADIAINVNWTSGVYYVNAYTQWMLNFPELISQKPIIIYNTDWLIKPVSVVTAETEVASIEVFPEGGLFITGDMQRAIIRTYSKNHLPAGTNFSLLENGKELLTGMTSAYGIGEISFDPKPGNTYIIQCQNAGKIIASVPFYPQVNAIAMTINSTNSKRISVQVRRTENTIPAYNKLLLVAVMNNKIVYNGIINFEEGSTAAAIARNKIPSGVIELMLIDQYEKIISDTKVFNPPIASDPHISLQHTEETNKISIDIPDSASLIAQVILSDKNENTLLQMNKLALLPDLQTEDCIVISNFTDSASVQLINQLLIQFSPVNNKLYSNLAATPKLQYMVESGITIKGNVKQYAGRPSLKSYEAELIVLGEDSTTMLAKAMTQENGQFIIQDANYKKSAKIYFQAHNPSNKKELMDIKLLPGYFDELKTATIKPRNILPVVQINDQTVSANDPIRNKLLKTKETDPRYIELQSVVIKAKKLNHTDSLKQEYLSPMFNDGNTMMIEPDGNYYNIWALIRGRVPGLQVEGDINNPSVSFSRYSGISGVTSQSDAAVDASLLAENVESIQFFLNEIPVSKDVLSSLSIEDVALITSNREPMPGLGASFGMISVYTKKGVSNTSSVYKSMAMEKRNGFSVTKNRYYETNENDQPGKTVYRTVFFPSTAKKILVPVFKNRTYRITLIGWNKKGNLIQEEKIIE
jgi:hypothetical protein